MGGTLRDDLTARVQANPSYQLLVKRRSRFGWTLAILMLAAYYGFILLIAFDRSLLARPVAGGVTSVGIVLGLGLIVFTVLITGVYVWRANGEFDRLTREIVAEVDQ